MRHIISTSVSKSFVVMFGFLAALLSSGAYAYGTTQCRSVEANGRKPAELQRVEEEIWGRNEVVWYYQGRPVDMSLVKVDEVSKNILSQSRLEDEVFGERLYTQFEINVTVVKESEADVGTRYVMICDSEEFPQLVD